MKVKLRRRKLVLPGLCTQRPDEEFVLENNESGIILHRAKPDIRKVYIEVTTRCNLRCKMCIRNAWDEPLGDMDEDTFEALLSQLAELPELTEVAFGGFGEPLIHPRIMRMLKAINALGVKVKVSTNGLLLDEEKAEALVDIGVEELVVSFDGATPKAYEAIRREADFRQLVENLRHLNEVKSRRNSPFPRIGIEFVAMRSNVGELISLVKLAKELQASFILVTHLLPYTEDMVGEILYSRDGDAYTFPVLPGWPLMSGGWLLWGTVYLPRSRWGAERRCRFIRDKATVVGWDGKVSPCYALMHSYPYYIFGRRKNVTRYILGDIHEQSLAEIWTSEEYVKFRYQVRNFRFPSCVDCDLGDTCDIRENNEGCWGWNPSCADCLWAQDIVQCP